MNLAHRCIHRFELKMFISFKNVSSISSSSGERRLFAQARALTDVLATLRAHDGDVEEGEIPIERHESNRQHATVAGDHAEARRQRVQRAIQE